MFAAFVYQQGTWKKCQLEVMKSDETDGFGNGQEQNLAKVAIAEQQKPVRKSDEADDFGHDSNKVLPSLLSTNCTSM